MASFREFIALAAPLALSVYEATNEVVPVINSTTGYFPGVIGGNGGLDVAKAKRLSVAAYSGVGTPTAAHRDKALLAAEACMQWQNAATYESVFYDGDDGSYPAQKRGDTSSMHKLHNKAMFLEHATRTVSLALTAGYTTFNGLSGVTSIGTLSGNINTSALWCLGSTDLFKFFKPGNVNLTNQMFRVALFLQEAGLLLGNTDLTNEAQTKVQAIFNQNMLSDPDGVIFVEKSTGTQFDTSYQTLSLELLAIYVLSLTAGAWKTTCTANLQSGLNKFLSYVAVDGSIDTSDNTRTEPQGARVQPGVNTPKGIDIDVIPWRMRLMAYVLGNNAYNDIADDILEYGQGYGHIEGDDGEGEDDEVEVVADPDVNQVTATTLTDSAYTLIATNPFRVRLIVTSGQGARIHLGTSLPSASTGNYFPLSAYKEFTIDRLGGCNLYARSEGSSGVLRALID